ncbi:hypothetical protein [Streptomyces phytophilus]|uniref:hypothetical protein n=1 Tax=Streptomyces phytophilus TaxID=722715 RepID=UPI0015F0A27F|nr:hypothetical protein [Streptomyces phytophilus]
MTTASRTRRAAPPLAAGAAGMGLLTAAALLPALLFSISPRSGPAVARVGAG